MLKHFHVLLHHNSCGSHALKAVEQKSIKLKLLQLRVIFFPVDGPHPGGGVGLGGGGSKVKRIGMLI